MKITNRTCKEIMKNKKCGLIRNQHLTESQGMSQDCLTTAALLTVNL